MHLIVAFFIHSAFFALFVSVAYFSLACIHKLDILHFGDRRRRRRMVAYI